ncbi:MAG: HAAS signaling domain-containing protein [Steroidobacteraceae bacterium]
MSTDPTEIQEWLRQLESSLASMSSPERKNILEEARSHLRERLAAGCTPSAALAGFGSPDDYAQRFVDEMQIESALGSKDTGALLHVVKRETNRDLVATLAGIGIAVLGVLSFAAVVTLIAKLSDPVHAGVWLLRPSGWIVGTVRKIPPADATELLGNWLYPLCGGVLALSWLSGRMLLLWAVRRIARGRGAALWSQ